MHSGNNSQDDQKSPLVNYRENIVDLERTIDTAKPRTLTDNSVEVFSDRVTDTIAWIRDTCKNEDFRAGKDAVLTYLRDARVKLDVASEEYKKRGRTQKFFDMVNKEGRELLEKALAAW